MIYAGKETIGNMEERKKDVLPCWVKNLSIPKMFKS